MVYVLHTYRYKNTVYLVSNIEIVSGWLFDAGRSIHSLTGFDVDTYQHSIVPMMRLTHYVRLPLVNLYRERMVQCPVRCNTAVAPLGRRLGMRQTRRKNLLPSSYWLRARVYVCLRVRARDQLNLLGVFIIFLPYFIFSSLLVSWLPFFVLS